MLVDIRPSSRKLNNFGVQSEYVLPLWRGEFEECLPIRELRSGTDLKTRHCVAKHQSELISLSLARSLNGLVRRLRHGSQDSHMQ